MTRDDAPIIKFENTAGIFFVTPSIVIDKNGIGFIWLFWALAFLWGKNEPK